MWKWTSQMSSLAVGGAPTSEQYYYVCIPSIEFTAFERQEYQVKNGCIQWLECCV